MGSIRAFGNNNRVSGNYGSGKTGQAAKAGAAAAGAAAAGAASTAPIQKAGDTVTLSGVAGQVGTASTISIPHESAGHVRETAHTKALMQAGKQLTPDVRNQKACEHMAQQLHEAFEQMFQAQ